MGGAVGSRMQSAMSNPMFYLGAQSLMQTPSVGRPAPNPFSMQNILAAQQMADAQKQRQFFPELIQEIEDYNKLSQAPTVESLNALKDLQRLGTKEEQAGFLDAEVYEEIDDLDQYFPDVVTTRSEDALGQTVDGVYEPPAATIDDMGKQILQSQSLMAADPYNQLITQVSQAQNPLNPTNLANRLLTSGVPSLQQAGLAQIFKPPSYMAVDPWQNIINTRTGQPVDLGLGQSGSMMDPRLMSSGFKGALSEGISPTLTDGTPNPEFTRRVRTLNQKTERTGPATIGTKLEQLNTAKDEGRITEEGYNNQVKQLLRKQWKDNITESDRQIEKDVSKKFTNWQFQGGRFQDLKDIDQVEQVIKDFLNDKPITGNILTNRLPKFLRTKLNPDSVMSEDRILEITQRTLREILGAQFTEKEGQLIMDRAWRKDLPAKELAKRAQKMIAVLKAKQRQLNEGYDYWRTEQINIEDLFYKPARSILGFEQRDGMSAEEFIESLNLNETALRGQAVGS